MPSRKVIALKALFLATSMLTVGATGTAYAQDQAAETVVVTGSHIATPGFTAPTPVTSISQASIENQNLLGTNQLAYELPQLTPQTNFQSFTNGPGATFLNLRGLGITRTLLLLDGRRVMPTSYDGTTDTNIIPTSLIKRVDVVTGGASAAYGSDAVSGVINFILDTNYEGLKGSFEAGQSQYHDNKTLDFQLTGGFEFDGGNGHAVFSGELYSDTGASGNIDSTGGVARRHWANQGYALIPGGVGAPTQIYPAGVTFSQMTPGGVIDSGPLKGIYFGAGGTLNNMVYGTNISTTYMVGGTGGQFQTFGSISPEVGRQDFFANVSDDILPNLTAWGQLLVTHDTGLSPITPNYDNGTGASPNLVISNTNPFIPAALRTLMTQQNVTSFVLGRGDLELGLNTSAGHYYYVNWDAGLKGKIGNNWTWDLTAQFTGDMYEFKTENERNNALWAQATNVIANPASGGAPNVAIGAPICSAALPANGGVTSCVPINLFGVGSITPAMAAYVGGSSVNDDPQQTWDVSANVAGVALKDWAGDVSVAAGGEVRRNSIHGYADAVSLAKEWRAGNTLPFTGSQQVEEGYVEVDVPLVKDVPGFQALNFNGAGRYTNYQTSGGVETWKLGLNDTVTDDIRVRTTYSSDIRAPTLNDLFAAGGNSVGQVFNDLTGSTQTVNTVTSGNPGLKPEQANTLTGGVVYQPSWLPGFQGSVDYYQIHLHGAIQATTAQQEIDNCYLYGVQTACSLLTVNAAGNITQILVQSYNLGNEQQDGVDIEADYNFPGNWILNSLDGNFNVRSVANFTNSITSTSTSGVVSNFVMQASGNPNGGAVPKWAVVVNTSYTTDKWLFELDYRYTGALRFNNLYTDGVDISNNHIGSRYYFNTLVQYQLFDHWKVFAAVDNIFNIAPPVDPSNNLIEPETLVAQVYDRIGRTYSAGVRFNF